MAWKMTLKILNISGACKKPTPEVGKLPDLGGRLAADSFKLPVLQDKSYKF